MSLTMSIDFRLCNVLSSFSALSSLFFRQIFGHWKTLLLFCLDFMLVRIFAMGQQVSSTHIRNYGKAQNFFFLHKKKFNKLYVCINKMLTRCNQTETFLLIEKTNRHCLPFLFYVCHKKDSTFLFSVFIQPFFTLYTFFSACVGLFCVWVCVSSFLTRLFYVITSAFLQFA